MCKVYPLNHSEMEELQKNLEKDCAKGFIKDRLSPCTAPVFFILKKDTKDLQMIVDYRKLNDVIIKDDYLLPDLWHKLDKLCRNTLFTKVDLHSGYNNICLEPKDAWKAVYKTPLGTHIPQVMGFGFSNALWIKTFDQSRTNIQIILWIIWMIALWQLGACWLSNNCTEKLFTSYLIY